ncbi:hypothetical protein FRC12_005621 [Ceratobasidium sp. 428]|nr:hypothetical protein FRC12_005621 [Ceratobasidium sp. 428]
MRTCSPKFPSTPFPFLLLHIMVRYLAAASIFVASTTIVRGADDNSTITAKFEKANTTVVPAIAKVPQLVWSVLNSVVGGRLYTNGAPFSRPCFANGTAAGSANVNACAAVQSNYLSNVYRADNFGAYINVSWLVSEGLEGG